MVLRSEKSPNRGLIWRVKVGLGLGEGKRVKWAEMRSGEFLGEPKRPVPDLREKDNGGGEVVVAEEVLVESLREGPEEKLVEREKETAEGWVVATEVVKGRLKTVMGILALMSG